MKEVWKRVRKIRGKYSTPGLPLLKDPLGILNDNPEITVNTFESVTRPENFSQQFLTTKNVLKDII